MAAIFAGELIEIALDTAAEDAAITAEIVTSQAEITESIVSAYEASIAEGTDVAETEAVTTAYNQLSMIDTEMADQWEFEVQAKYGKTPVDENPGEPGSKYDDTTPESNPNKAEIDEDSDIAKKTNCGDNPEGEACVEAEAKNYQKYWKYTKNILKAAGPLAGIAGGLIALFTYLIGGAVRLWCQMICGINNKCKKDGEKCGDCQNFGCSCEKYCETNTCQTVKSMVQNIRKYFWYIAIPFLILSIALVVWLKSIGLSIFFSIIFMIFWLLKTWVGNFVATAVCNWAAFGCAVSQGNATCTKRG